MPSVKLLGFIFITFFKVALFVIGGGFAMVPVIEDIFVRHKKMLTSEDILDMVAVTQTMPGMIAVNEAIFIGHKLAGWIGSAVAIVGVILPSIIILTIIAALWPSLDVGNEHVLKAFSCVRACVAAVFCGTAYRIGRQILKGPFDYILVILCFVALAMDVPSLVIILTSIPIGWGYIIVLRYLSKRRNHG